MIDLEHPFHVSAVRLYAVAAASLAIASVANTGQAAPASTFLPTGLNITPTAAPGSAYEALNPNLTVFPNFIASGALSSVKSPDGKTLLVLVSGHNSLSDKSGSTIAKDSNEYIFIFDISAGKPVAKQIIQIPNSFVGIVFDPSGQNFYVGGGVDDDVHQYSLTGGTWTEKGNPILLNHNGISNALTPKDIGALTAGIDITQDGYHAICEQRKLNPQQRKEVGTSLHCSQIARDLYNYL